MPSAVVITLFVLVLDVLALWIISFALLQIAAYLNTRKVYDRHQAVEFVPGRSHGPIGFRVFQVVLTVVLFASSIAVCLSIDGFSVKGHVPVPEQTILVPQERRMDEIGVGEVGNFTKDVLFVRSAFQCASADHSASVGTQTIRNALALEPIGPNQYQQLTEQTFPLKCLSDNTEFSVSAVRKRTFSHTKLSSANSCILRVPTLREIQSGNFTAVLKNNCPWHSEAMKCQALRRGGCALPMDLEEDQAIFTWGYHLSPDTPMRFSRISKLLPKRDTKTLEMMAKYIDFGIPAADPGELEHITSFRAGKRSIDKFEGRWLRTRIEPRKFLSGTLIIAFLVLPSIVAAVVSCFKMKTKGRSNYALGLRPADVARFTKNAIGDIQGEDLFLTLDSDSARLTVKGNTANCGSWTVQAVMEALKAVGDDDGVVASEATGDEEKASEQEDGNIVAAAVEEFHAQFSHEDHELETDSSRSQSWTNPFI